MKTSELNAKCSMPMMLLTDIEFKHSIVRKANMLEQLVLTLLSEPDNTRLISNCLADYGINESLHNLIAHFIFELKKSGVLEIKTNGNSEEELAKTIYKMPLTNLSLTADGLRLYRDDYLPTNEISRPQSVTIGYDIVNDVFQRQPKYNSQRLQYEEFISPSFDKIDIDELKHKVTSHLGSYNSRREMNLNENENIIDVNVPDPINVTRDTYFNIKIMEEGCKLEFKTDAEFTYFIENYPIEAKKEIFLNAMRLKAELMDIEYPILNFSDIANATAIHTYNELQSLGQKECNYYIARGSDWNRKEFFAGKKTVSQDKAYNILHRLSKYCDAAFFSKDKCVFFETVKLSIPHVGVTNFSIDGIFHIERTATKEQLAELDEAFPELGLSLGKKEVQKPYNANDKYSNNLSDATTWQPNTQTTNISYNNDQRGRYASNTTTSHDHQRSPRHQEQQQKPLERQEPHKPSERRDSYKPHESHQRNKRNQDMPLYTNFNGTMLRGIADKNAGRAVKFCCIAAHQVLSAQLQINEKMSFSKIIYTASAQKIIDQKTGKELLMMYEANGLLNKEGFTPYKLKRVTTNDILTWIGVVESLITKLNNTK